MYFLLNKKILLFCIISIIIFSCKDNAIKNKKVLFKTLQANETGINFANTLTLNKELNLLSYMYYYNGAGVGSGDFNNDGLIDLFFTANQGDNKLFLNKGNLKFNDVTTKANIPQDKSWSTGVSVVDINNDGLLDIYICKVGHYKSLKSVNQLLVCQGIDKDSVPFYKDEAIEYGLAFSGFSTQATFLDYDKDGDLDMFLLNHSVNHDGNFAPRKVFENTYDSFAGQKLYRNNLTKISNKTKSNFVDITKQSGINGSKIGYGLGISIADINSDGWPDIYVGNDFHENDYLYINQKNGKFIDKTTEQIKHTSMFSMGVDIADINNDAHPEIISVDMLPYNPEIAKRSLAEDDYTIYNEKISYGYNYQYARNNLQYNNGNNTFSEIGEYAGIYNTDWSWGPLWVDFNNDGLKDLFISNGIPKRMNDIDYVNFIADATIQNSLQINGIGDKELELINKFPEIKIPNQFFINQGNKKFLKADEQIDNNAPTFSNGSIYADLDNDGDLDIVVNNINENALVYENKTNSAKTKAKKYAEISLKGDEKNINAIGAKIIVFAKDNMQTYENNPVHGFQSSMVSPIHIGLDSVQIDSTIVIWPNDTYQKINININNSTTINFMKGLPLFDYNILSNKREKNNFNLKDITAETKLNYTHTENVFNEFDREPLLPFMNTTQGPALAVADINGDGMDDVFIGASKTFHNAIYIQKKDGSFNKTKQLQMELDSMWENNDAVWVDVNNDKFVDLIITSGGNEYYNADEHLLPLLYLNDGKGNMSRKKDAFPNIFQTQSTIKANDFDNDGKVDLFIGCNAEPFNYGKKVVSYLLKNDGTGKFTDVSKQIAPTLDDVSMITNAEWVDYDNDKDIDLVTTSYWGTVNIFINTKGKFNLNQISDKKGLWNFATPIDIDNDGDLDFIAGNEGNNTQFNATEKQPLQMYFNDFDGNGKNEQIVTYFLNGTEIPLSSKLELEKRLPFIKKKFLFAKDYCVATLYDVFQKEKINNAVKSTANFLSSAVFINQGKNDFEVAYLPDVAQWSSLKSAIVLDLNGDKYLDAIVAGNFYENNIQIGRLDANYGNALINNGKGNFNAVEISNLVLNGQVRKISPIKINNKPCLIFAKNNAPIQIIRIEKN